MRTRALMDYWQIDELLLGQIEHPGHPDQRYPKRTLTDNWQIGDRLDFLDHEDLGYLYSIVIVIISIQYSIFCICKKSLFLKFGQNIETWSTLNV